MPDADRVLHPTAGLRPGSWYACEHPDWAPVVDVTAFDPGCPACSEILDKVNRLSPGARLTMTGRSRGGVERTDAGTTVAERLARARARKN